MKKKIIKKKENKQIVEIHIYVHQEVKNPYPSYNPNGTGGNGILPPPHITLC